MTIPRPGQACGRAEAFLTKRAQPRVPVLARLLSGRVRRSAASMRQQKLDPSSSVVGIEVKALGGAVFAEIVSDVYRAYDIRALARHAMTLASADSYSPARIDAFTVLTCHDNNAGAH